MAENVTDLRYFKDKAEMLKALGHPARLCIVKGLMDKGSCNVSHMQDCLGLPQSTISQHLGRLRSAGVIDGLRSGLEINYEVVSEEAKKVIKSLFS